MCPLSSRERVRRALNREETDRVPVDFGGSRITAIAAIAYRNLLAHLGRTEVIRVYDIKQQLAAPSLAMIDALGGDIVQLHRLGPTTGMPFLGVDAWKPGTLTDGTPCEVPAELTIERDPDATLHISRGGERYAWRTPESLYFNVDWTPLGAARSPADIDAFAWPDPWTPREERFLREQIATWYHHTDKALFAGLPVLNGSFFEISLLLFGFENFMMLMYEDPDLVEYWLDRLLAHDCDILARYLAIAGPYIEAIQMNDDFGTQTDLQISPAFYRRFFKPRQRQWIEFVKARTNARVFLHCDGAVREILPDFIDIGIDILNPLQTSARGMDAASIKRDFGRHLSFWGGGVDTQATLPFGTVDDVRREARDRVARLGAGGGYVFAPIHNIQADIPPEKILAVYESAAPIGRA